MSEAPTFDDIFAVMSAASVGDRAARVALPDDPHLDDVATKFALALNILLDDLTLSAADVQHELAERGRLAKRFQIISDASREFSAATSDINELLALVARRLGELVGDMCVIKPISEDGEWLEYTGAVYHRSPELLAVTRELLLSDRQRVGEGFLGRIAAAGQPILIPRTDTATFAASTEPRYRPLIEQLGIASAIALPLLCQGKVVGAACVLRGSSDHPYNEDDFHFVQSVADHAGLAIGNARSYAAERAARAAAEKAKDDARASEVRYRLMFDNSPLPKWMHDVETLRFLDVNAAAVRDYGYSRDEFLAMTIKDIRPPEDVPALVEEERGAATAPKFGVWRLRKKSGEIIQVEITKHTFTLGDRACRLVVGRDVTERLRLEEQLRQSQKMEAVGRLAGGVAHDFNNVLSVILSYGDFLFGDMKPGEPMRDDVEEIRKAALRATDLTRQLLMFSRQQVLEPRVLDLNEVLASMDKMLQRILGADVDLVSLPTEPLGRVRVDPSTIEQVIMNLVVNARDAMPTGGQLTMETGNVDLDAAYAREHLGVTPGPHVMLAVTDTGSGMDRATLSRIFEPFFTTKGIGKGTGLGLSTVFGIVQQSGGSVWVYSELGKGTTFKVYLRRVDAAAEPIRAPKSLTTTRGSETILLVEDDDQVRAVARGILARNGYHVIEARNAGEALLHSERHPSTIHLLLSDVVMPQMSGPELAKRLAASRPAMKVLCMSGYTDDSIVRHGVLDAHLAYLQKPITPEGLTKRVREVLGGTEQRDTLGDR
jgi:PAS domain S-box-containing protein